MLRLFISSLLLSFSIPLNKMLFNELNPFVISTIFCLSSLIVFIKFCNWKNFKNSDAIKLMAIGGIQFGLMYSLFQSAFLFLHGHEVALLMLTTPIYVVLVNSILSKNWDATSIIAATIVSLFALCLSDFSQKFCFRIEGIFLTQACNLSFAIGQILLKRFCREKNIKSVLRINALLFLGATIVCAPMAIFSAIKFQYQPFTEISLICAIIFGIIFCGLSHWLWNAGATLTSVTTLAVMNNMQIPLAIIVSCTFFNEKMDVLKFSCSAICMALMLSICKIMEKKQKL